MKLIVPEDRTEITLGMYMDYMDSMHDNATDDEMIDKMYVSFTNAEDTYGVSLKDKIEVVDLITKAFQKENILNDRFDLNGIEYGRIPNYDKISNSEYNDLGMYGVPDEREYSILTLDYENLHRFMAINYRPIIQKDGFKNYLIESYEDTSNADVMKDVPLSFVIGLDSFFLTLRKDLESHLLTCTEEEQQKKI